MSYTSRIGDKDTYLILSQKTETMETSKSPTSHKQRRKDSRRRSKPSPPKENPGKKQKRDCAKCEEDLGEISITCTGCQLSFCQPCSVLDESFIKAWNAGLLPGVDWKCKSCIETSASLENIDKKIVAMGQNNNQRLTGIEKSLEGLEERITSKITAEIPNMIQKEITEVRESLERTVKEEVGKVEEEVSKKVTENVKNLDRKIEEVRDTVPKREDMEGIMRNMIREEMGNTAGTSSGAPPISPGTQMKKTVASVTAEIREKAKREKRIIIYNLKEHETNLKTERVNRDKDKFIDIATNIMGLKNMKKDDILMADRLGEKEADKPRPLLMEFHNLTQKNIIMKKAVNLHGSEYEHLSIKYDMTVLEREHKKKLTEEAKRRNDESEGKWQYRVRGPPWDLRIVKTRKITAEKNEQEDGNMDVEVSQEGEKE